MEKQDLPLGNSSPDSVPVCLTSKLMDFPSTNRARIVRVWLINSSKREFLYFNGKATARIMYCFKKKPKTHEDKGAGEDASYLNISCEIPNREHSVDNLSLNFYL